MEATTRTSELHPGTVCPDGMDASRTLGENVHELRVSQDLTKSRFSMMARIGRPFLDKIERGEAQPKLNVLQRLADALGVDVAMLLIPRR